MRTSALMVKVMSLIPMTCIAFVLGLASTGWAASTSASASATVVTPLSITKTADLQFGKLIAGTGGSVALSTAGARTATGGVTLFTQGSTQTAAAFTVTGEGTYTYVITLPSGAVTISDGSSHDMTVDTFTSNPSGTGTLTGGTQNLLVGATLTVASGQAPGAYAGSFNVTVDYQ